MDLLDRLDNILNKIKKRRKTIGRKIFGTQILEMKRKTPIGKINKNQSLARPDCFIRKSKICGINKKHLRITTINDEY